MSGKSKIELFSGFYPGPRESPFMFPLPAVASGKYIIRFTDEAGKNFDQDIIITQ